MKFRSIITWPLKRALAYAGKDIINRNKYGYNILVDIERLSRTWGQTIDVFFDVGANVGQTIRSVRSKFDDCHIVAFEPHPQTFVKLKENTKALKAAGMNTHFYISPETAHEWQSWRRGLYQFAPLLFKD